MVALVTNHTTDYIRRKMPYAQALQYRTLYCDLNEIPYAKHEARPKQIME